MSVAILVITCFILLFVMSVAGSLIKIEKMLMALTQAKLEEMKLWTGANVKK